MQIHPIGLQRDAGSDSEEASTVDNAKLVYCFSTDSGSSNQPINIVEEGSTDVIKFSLNLGAKQAVIIQKAAKDLMWADDPAIKFTPIAYSN